MITNKDLDIENISYTNKDFGQIYPELIELAKSLTNKWDPTATNESDPGIVLIKLIAFLGDKLNYNIDKNALEQFITSATQETSMRELTELLGYNMHYYRSAIASVNFRYLGDMGQTTTGDAQSLKNASSFRIKAFDTTFKTEDNISYVLLDDIVVSKDKKYIDRPVRAIQGEEKKFTVTNGNNLVQLYNLDDSNRIYFPDVDVAENGVFINKDEGAYDTIINPECWHRVDSLNDQDLGQKIFKFGFDSDKGFPYIEFPKDISDLIGDGLSIDYIVSDGLLGKVTGGKLTTISSVAITYTPMGSTESQSFSSSLEAADYILNNSASSEAADPETLDEAYNNFKTTIGTFNTLVSCRDYSNYFRNYLDDLNKKLVNNVSVTDVRTDPCYSQEILSRDTAGNAYYRHEPTTYSKGRSFDVILHGFSPINAEITSNNLYELSYNPLSASDLTSINSNFDLNNVKSLVHTFVLPKESDINNIEARYQLNCTIVLKSQLSADDLLEVYKSIRTALYKSYNSSKVDFGEELPYESLIDTIKNADTRIKTVNLMTPSISYFAKLRGNNESIDLSSYNTESAAYLKKVILDNILAGRLPLYFEDTSFSYDFNMDLATTDAIKQYPHLAGAEASVTIPVVSDESSAYTLKENESVQLIEDSFITQVTYPAFVYYTFVKRNSDQETIIVPKNTTHKLAADETLYIQYTDDSDVVKFITYTSGTVIKPNFDLINLKGKAVISTSNVSAENTAASKFVDWNHKKVYKNLDYSEYINHPDLYSNITPLFAIGTNEQIDILKKNAVTLPYNSKCYWYIKPKIKSDEDNTSPFENENNSLIFNNLGETTADGTPLYTYILEEGEYFIYPTSDNLSLNILSAGTKLQCDKNKLNRKNPSELIDLDLLTNSMQNDDISAFEKSFSWEYLSTPLIVTETSISTFVNGDVIIKNGSKITSNWQSINAGSFAVQDSDITISSEASPFIRSVLSLAGSTAEPQTVKNGQTIKLVYATNVAENGKETNNTTFTVVKLDADSKIQITPEVDIYNNEGVLAGYQYNQVGSKLIQKVTDSGKILHNFTYAAINYADKAVPAPKTLSHFIQYVKNDSSTDSRGEYVIPAATVKRYFDDLSSSSTPHTLTCDINNSLNLTVSIFDSHSEKTSLIKNEVGSNITIDLSDFYTNASAADNLYISNPKSLSVYSYLNILGSNFVSDLLNELNTSYPYFDPLAPANSYKRINSYTPLYSYLDKNNIYNKLTISKIDFDKSQFNVAGGVSSW